MVAIEMGEVREWEVGGRNVACGCGSGRKRKHCCAREAFDWRLRRDRRASLRRAGAPTSA
jgi:hypothetical protein